ncbi:hypothetical protein PPYR_10998 [Photinus pyralis]|uniref:Protein HIRA n=1 Tax=Photinus pyralis TaxID=7054 RepID=A0A5N4AHY8_PHOPY|nr:protein HIRA homolog [Photinus pyralis]KAB0796937.1 hypothetical protein PPYR_10998 [Photinus pyralis]
MKLLKPTWVTHEDSKPIFSVDIHPKGNKFATGGQGGQGGRVVIWNLAPVLNEADELDPKIPKMLCQMDNHLSCVNVVRWSCEGHLLASGGDDKLVMIWKLTGEGSSSVFGGGGKINVETWKCVTTLNSHSGDVLDLAWAPHDGWLASGSVDNTVIIWNVQKLPEKVAVLKSHTGMVKGVAWDPIGKYLASQSDDRSLRVWRTADWAQQEVVTDCFVDCSATTHVLRLSWSPDGQYLVSAHAMNGGGPTAQIIERDGWKQDKDFVGHRKAITCVRFNSNILKKLLPSSPKTQQYCCCAIGSRDRSLSVWLTSLKRPLVVIKDLFDDSVLDISWSSNGMNLLACSWDGTVACVVFVPQEIGHPLLVDEKNALYERMYGKSLQRNWNQSFTGSQIIENPELLQAMEEINDQQRIQPSIQKEIPKLVTPPAPQESPKSAPPLVVPNKQIETRLPSGKRRITPMFLTAAPVLAKDSLEVSLMNEISTSFSSSSPSKSKIIVETRKECAPVAVQSQSVPPASNKTVEAVQSTTLPKAQPPGVQINQLMCSDVPGDQPIVHFISVLEPLKLPSGSTVTKKTSHIKMQITNGCNVTSKGSFAKVEMFKNVDDNQPIWETFLGSTIRCVAANRKFVVVCCDDMTVNCFFVKSGSKVFPSLLIEDSAVSICISECCHCLVLTKTGLLHMWDLENEKSILSRISLRSLLSNKASVSSCTLTDANLPLVTLTDGRAYSYSLNMQTWVLLSNPLDPVSKAGGSLSKSLPSTLPLASLQKSIPIHGAADTLPSGVTLSFLESQIAASSLLRSAAEFKHWLMATVNHLLEKGPECRLRSILDELMNSKYSKSSKVKGSDCILGLNKEDLLKEILKIIKPKLPWQRLYKEYNEQIVAES